MTYPFFLHSHTHISWDTFKKQTRSISLSLLQILAYNHTHTHNNTAYISSSSFIHPFFLHRHLAYIDIGTNDNMTYIFFKNLLFILQYYSMCLPCICKSLFFSFTNTYISHWLVIGMKSKRNRRAEFKSRRSCLGKGINLFLLSKPPLPKLWVRENKLI